MTRSVEICVESAAGAEAAGLGGANRVELCRDRAVGGVTPAPEQVSAASRLAGVPLHVLIRPRAGDFFFQKDEITRMADEIADARAHGASGVVIGALVRSGRIDRGATARLADLARPLSVTFHKAFDETTDPFAALDVLIELGIDRVLTSGHAPSVRNGMGTLSRLVEQASGRIVILAGGGLTLDDLPTLSRAGIAEIHAASCVLERGQTDENRVRSLVQAWSGMP